MTDTKNKATTGGDVASKTTFCEKNYTRIVITWLDQLTPAEVIFWSIVAGGLLIVCGGSA